MEFTYVVGRAIFGAFFLQAGINHFKETEAMAGYAAAKHLPYPELSVRASGAVLVASGLSLLVGIKPRLGSAGVVSFLTAATMQMHDFWNQSDPGQKQNEMIHFSKNIALLGAAMAIGASSEK
jgi:putative oxidoreductase